MNFDQSPMLVIWEATQACDLACVHCRASAQSERSPGELTTEQGYRLLDEIRSFGEPLMVFTGGDPLKRPDLLDLIRYSVKIGCGQRDASATPLLTNERRQVQSRRQPDGDQRGRTTHVDDFRGIPARSTGRWSLRHARDIGLDTQFQTTVTRRNRITCRRSRRS